jgi:plasmid stability protein
MAQVVIRGLDAEVVEKLKERAQRSGRSLEAELRFVLRQAASEDYASARAAVERVRALFEGRRFTDSTKLVREDRDR